MPNRSGPSASAFLHVAANGLVVSMFLFPLAWMGLGAFKSDGDLLSPSPVWLFAPTLDHWRFIFANWAVGQHLLNSIIISVATTAATLALGFPAAYGLSRFPLWRKDAVLFDILSLKMIPPIAAAVPLFLFAKQTGIYNTYLVLILFNTAFQLPFTILVLKSFIDEIPREIDEAATIDGCSPLGAMWRAILPLALPGLICCALFVFIFTWNEFLLANVMVAGDLRPLPPIVGLALTHRGILWGPALALGLVVLLPVLALSFSLSRYMARGLTFGAVKG
ncbi:carbohydrate ABC transporter permease [Taklimakanibacter deserti]|uniref:carbohydrate ABC transporter permease n=1 Tax=Taklimakanibacter deserti TaxID=2267839 RepID=UPI000E647F0C